MPPIGPFNYRREARKYIRMVNVINNTMSLTALARAGA